MRLERLPEIIRHCRTESIIEPVVADQTGEFGAAVTSGHTRTCQDILGVTGFEGAVVGLVKVNENRHDFTGGQPHVARTLRQRRQVPSRRQPVRLTPCSASEVGQSLPEIMVTTLQNSLSRVMGMPLVSSTRVSSTRKNRRSFFREASLIPREPRNPRTAHLWL